MIPNLFKKEPIPKIIPAELEEKIQELSRGGDKEQFIREAFFYIVSRYGGSRTGLICDSMRILETDISKIYITKGYMHCTTMNYLIRVMCIKSCMFDESEIKLKFTHTWYIMPHQFLEIYLGHDSIIELDPWNYQFGIEYGEYGSGFDSLHIYPIR